MLFNNPQKNFFQTSNLTSLPTIPPETPLDPEPQSLLNSSFEESSFKSSPPDVSQNSFTAVNVIQSRSIFVNPHTESLNDAEPNFFSLVESPYFGDERNFRKN